jgi:hypothetical protein
MTSKTPQALRHSSRQADKQTDRQTSLEPPLSIDFINE